MKNRKLIDLLAFVLPSLVVVEKVIGLVIGRPWFTVSMRTDEEIGFFLIAWSALTTACSLWLGGRFYERRFGVDRKSIGEAGAMAFAFFLLHLVVAAGVIGAVTVYLVRIGSGSIWSAFARIFANTD